MGIVSWWEGHPRTRRNIVVMFVFDAALLLLTLLRVPYLGAWWSVFTQTIPNLYQRMFSQLLAVLFELPPDTGAGGAPLYYTTTFLSLLTLHFCIAFLVGWLLRKRDNSGVWRVVNYSLLFFLLLVLHLIGTFFRYFAY